MSFLSFIARRGAVGSAARWAASMYREAMKQDPSLDLEDIVASAVIVRYSLGARAHPTGRAAKTLTCFVKLLEDRTTMHRTMRSMTHFVVLILVAEAGFLDNALDVQGTFVEVIADELARKGVPKEYALGKDVDRLGNPFSLLKHYAPSMFALHRMLAAL